jgi:transcriptional regulator with XRE-family HTH domain
MRQTVGMSREPTPTIRRWQLGQQLRQLREQTEVSPAVAAKEIGVSTSSLSRIETGKQFIKPPYVKLLSLLYEVSPKVRTELMLLAEEAGQPEWYAALAKNVPDWFRQYLGYESVASTIKTWCSELVPGLLQTSDYAEAIFRVGRQQAGSVALEQSVELRRQRQERASHGDLQLTAVLNEAVLLRPVGGPAVFREQLRHIAEVSEKPGITVQVLPFAVGEHPAITAPFVMLGFTDHPQMSTVYLENGRGALYLESAPDLESYGWRFEQLLDLAETPEKSRDRLVRVASDL